MFGFGASKAKQTSSSQQTASSLATSSSISRGTSQSTSGGYSGSGQSVAFADYFAQLFGGASNATVDAVANAPLFEEEAAQLFTGGMGFLDTLRAPAGSEYMAGRLAGPDMAAEAQIGELGSRLSSFFDEQLMPAITGRGVSTGTLGGSRQAVATGQAAGQVSDSYSSGVASILATSQAQRDSLAATAGSQSIGAASAGLAAIPGLTDVASAGANASLNPYLMLSQILGGPTTLTESYSEQASQSSSEDIAEAISRAISESQGTSTSSGKSSSFNFGFGGAGAG